MALRSLLYAPGNEPRKVAKVGTLGADGVILDLEDAVPIGEKIATREVVRQAIPSVKATAGRVYVRINPTGQKADFSVELGIGDIEAIVCAELDGIVVPKVESAEEIAEVDRVLADEERKIGLPQGTLEVTPIIETALGLWNAFEIARSSERIGSLHFGAGDFTRDVGIEWSRDETELVYARSRLVMISRAAAIEPPTDSVWVLLDDREGLAESVRRAKSLGFQGKSCIHPNQVETINRGFSYVSPAEVARARKIVDAFTEAEARRSASILVDGEFIDYPLAERARQVLRLHTEMQGRES